MKNSTIRLIMILLLPVMLACATGCRDIFSDPLTDKESGGPVTLLLLDRNFIKLRLAVQLVNHQTEEVINSEEVTVAFSGTDANSLIDFSGYKKSLFTTSSGFVEVGFDPNRKVSADQPAELTVMSISDHYISAPQVVSFTEDGLKTIIIRMVPIGGFKSVGPGPWSEPYEIRFNGTLNSGQLRFVSDIRTLPTGTAWNYIGLYTPATTGSLLCSNLKDNVLYTDYGCYIYSTVNPGGNVAPPAPGAKSASLLLRDYVYSAVLKSGMSKCGKGLVIHSVRADGRTGSGVFHYRLTFADGSLKEGQIPVNFPSDYLIEPIYYPAAGSAVKVELFGDSQYDVSGPVNLTNVCGATAGFVFTPKRNLVNYRFVVRYSCPDSQVGLGLTILGEFRKKDSDDPWTTFQFVEGVCDLQMEKDADYAFRFNIDSKYYSYYLPTDPARVEEFLTGHQSSDYKLKTLRVEPSESGVLVVSDVEFSQGVCDAIR